VSNDLIVKALIALGHNSGWALTGETLDGLVFDDETKKPTAKQINDKIAELPAIEATKAAQDAAKKQALLDKLGITEEEAALLLGGN
jgi:hypothetical protein